MRILVFVFFLLLINTGCQNSSQTNSEFEALVDKVSYKNGYERSYPVNVTIELLGLDKDYVITGYVDSLAGKNQLSEKESILCAEPLYSKKLREKKRWRDDSERVHSITFNSDDKDIDDFDRKKQLWDRNIAKWKSGELKASNNKRALKERSYNHKDVDPDNITQCVSYMLGYTQGSGFEDERRIFKLNDKMVLSGFIDRLNNSPQMADKELFLLSSMSVFVYTDQEKDDILRRMRSRLNTKRENGKESIEEKGKRVQRLKEEIRRYHDKRQAIEEWSNQRLGE